MKNTGLEYEQLIAQLFKSIAHQEGLQNINIQRNVILNGKAGGTHQIDIYWEFELLGINHKIVIEAKDYASKVTQEKLLAFKSILDDIAGQPRGVYITKTGYQTGAKKFAEHHGIILYEFRPPNDNDWKGKMRDLIVALEINIPTIDNIILSFDRDWLNDFLKKNSINIAKGYNISVPSQYMFFYDENEQQLYSLQEKINSLIPQNSNETNFFVHKKFNDAVYVRTLDKNIPKLKITEVYLYGHFNLVKDTLEIHGDDIIKFILKDVLNNNIKRINSNLQELI